jgi:putative membrane protein
MALLGDFWLLPREREPWEEGTGNTARLTHDMKAPNYSRFERTMLILRDELAIDRTLLANERTLLSYLRFSVALLIAGVTIIHFAEQGWFWAIGIACLPAGVLCGVIGTVRFLSMHRAIMIVRNREDGKGGAPDTPPTS